MATKAHVTVGYFRVESHCQKAGNPVKKIPLGSSDVEHVLEFENGSTLPYDVQAESTHPDAPKLIDFTHGGFGVGTVWKAYVSQIGSGDTEKDAATINCVTTSKATARIQTPVIEYRLDSADAWQNDPTSTTLLEIKMDIE
jgi:hypothetical protein